MENVRSINPETLTINELYTLAKLVQSEQGIEVLKYAHYEPYLYRFLASNYVDCEEQYFSTGILCNLYYMS